MECSAPLQSGMERYSCNSNLTIVYDSSGLDTGYHPTNGEQLVFCYGCNGRGVNGVTSVRGDLNVALVLWNQNFQFLRVQPPVIILQVNSLYS